MLKSGYNVTLEVGTDATVVLAAASTCNGSTDDAVATYYAHAEPASVGSTGQRSFASDQRGALYFNADGAAIGADMGLGTILQ